MARTDRHIKKVPVRALSYVHFKIIVIPKCREIRDGMLSVHGPHVKRAASDPRDLIILIKNNVDREPVHR